uniref:Uncharacterized protein n=1 Tax=Ananas comosus var. bracteatus TaxID=296719 RepID=A0A6V7PD20_ANACO|nr:unnamed protein product [Ananas comosus var. bracteatus]
MALEVRWYDFVCFAIVVGAILVSLWMILKSKGDENREGRTKYESLLMFGAPNDGFGFRLSSRIGCLNSSQLWKSCWRGLHPTWLLIFRMVAMVVMVAIFSLVMRIYGSSIMLYYTDYWVRLNNYTLPVFVCLPSSGYSVPLFPNSTSLLCLSLSGSLSIGFRIPIHGELGFPPLAAAMASGDDEASATGCGGRCPYAPSSPPPQRSPRRWCSLGLRGSPSDQPTSGPRAGVGSTPSPSSATASSSSSPWPPPRRDGRQRWVRSVLLLHPVDLHTSYYLFCDSLRHICPRMLGLLKTAYTENDEANGFLNDDPEENPGDRISRPNKNDDQDQIRFSSHHGRLLYEERAGFWGYLMQIIYQTSAGAVVLTDVVFWGLLVPFLSSEYFRVNLIMACMHSVNAVFLLIDTALNNLPFPWFGMAYFIFWSCIYVVFQWVLHACGSTWWPYPFLELATPWAPLWYFFLALVHILCFSFYWLIAKAKVTYCPKLFPHAYVGLY